LKRLYDLSLIKFSKSIFPVIANSLNAWVEI
jgi:hypothetical protein